MKAEAPTQRSISRIQIRRLFGQYDYDIPTEANPVDTSRLLILYGDNGSGKTTTLRLIYHLLSPSTNRGHRSYLAHIPFAHLSVELSDGATVSADRVQDASVGPFVMSIRRPGEEDISALLRTSGTGGVPPTPPEAAEELALWEGLEALGINLYFVADDRTVSSDTLPSDLAELSESERLYRRIRAREAETIEEERNLELKQALERASITISQQALSASSAATTSANTIYADVVRKIIKSGQTRASVSKQQLSDLVERMQRLERRSDYFAEFGLTSGLDVAPIAKALADVASPSTRALLHGIVAPYLEGVEARLSALQDVERTVRTLVQSLNSFYVGKRVEFDVRRGFRIAAPDGSVIPPTALSSGERQLLLLLCNVVYARQQATVFVIDEPELSLNIKWQRQLLRALLDCAGESPIQFLLATHSIELLSPFRGNVVKLQPKDMRRRARRSTKKDS